MNSVVLVSGGVNSAVLVALAREETTPALLHVNFQQRTAQRDAQAFDDIANHYQISQRKVVELPYFAEFGGNSRVDKRMNIEDVAATSDPSGPPSTYVPGLIPAMLAVAHTWAAGLGAQRIYVGSSENLGPPGGVTGQLYPDCKREFYQYYNYVLSVFARPRFEPQLVTPFIDLTRADVVKLAQQSEVPLELTWSCYRSATRPCGSCYRCAVRARGFADAGVPDPLMAQVTA